jgi:L-ascorbate metabolism protein UlaG (beta-lactamase superfamily)
MMGNNRITRIGLFPKTVASLFIMFMLIGSGESTARNASPIASEMTRQSAQPQTAQLKTNEVRVTFVGNAGFLITVNNKKILIDALFSGYPGDYILPREIQDKLAFGRPPFDGIDLILATHSHGDHFDQGLMRRFLRYNPAAVFASTPQITALLHDLPGRVITFRPTKNKTVHKDIQGVHVEAVYLSHGAPATGKTEILNFGYLVTINGIKLFHTGDIDISQFSFAEFRALHLPERKIDLAFIQHFYLTDAPAERKFIQEGIAALYIFPMHYHYTVPPMSPAAVLKNYPAAILFDAELQSWVMPQVLKASRQK